MALFSAMTGGFLSTKDMATHEPLWVNPLSLDYRGLTVNELPRTARGSPFRAGKDSADSVAVLGFQRGQ